MKTQRGAWATLDAVVAALAAEAVTERIDAKRAAAREFVVLGEDLGARADRLDRLASLLRDVRKGRSA